MHSWQSFSYLQVMKLFLNNPSFYFGTTDGYTQAYIDFMFKNITAETIEYIDDKADADIILNGPRDTAGYIYDPKKICIIFSEENIPILKNYINIGYYPLTEHSAPYFFKQQFFYTPTPEGFDLKDYKYTDFFFREFRPVSMTKCTLPWRENIVDLYKAVRKNTPGGYNAGLEDKLRVIDKHVFCLAIENSLSNIDRECYVTEKCIDAAMAGCIPLYSGGNIDKYTVLNPHRVLQIRDDDKCRIIDLKTIDRQFVLDTFNMPILADNHLEKKEEMFYNLKKLIFR